MTCPDDAHIGDWAERLRQGDRRALARAITCIENGAADADRLLAAIYPHGGRAHVIGVTGAPGTGKSTLVNALARDYRRRGLTVGILAIDPSSPFTGGAILGDRLRMRDLAGDPGIFIRSMASRGSTGGLSRMAADAVHALDAAGYERIIVETVGAGQDEVEVARLAHTVIVVEAPGLGDDIQAIKAGILETASILVVNKADRDGAEQTIAGLRMMLELRHPVSGVVAHHGTLMSVPAAPAPEPADLWQPPLIAAVATEGRGAGEIVEAIEAHRAHLATTSEGAGLAARRAEAQLGRALDAAMRRLLAQRVDPAAYRALLQDVIERRADPRTAAERLLACLCSPMEMQPHVAQNAASLARLRALAARLSDADLQRSIGHGWTVSAALAHLAYWDRRNLATLEEWERSGVQVSRVNPDPINDSLLPQWLAMPPRQAVADALAAAEDVDRKVEGLPSQLVEAILAQRPRTIIRAIHRNEHLDEIEHALSR